MSNVEQSDKRFGLIVSSITFCFLLIFFGGKAYYGFRQPTSPESESHKMAPENYEMITDTGMIPDPRLEEAILEWDAALSKYEQPEKNEELPVAGDSPITPLYEEVFNCFILNSSHDRLFYKEESLRPVLRQRFKVTLAKLDWIIQREGMPKEYQEYYQDISGWYNEVKGDEPLPIWSDPG